MVQLRMTYIENTLRKEMFSIEKKISKLLEGTEYCWFSEEDGRLCRFFMSDFEEAIKNSEIKNEEVLKLYEKWLSIDNEIDESRMGYNAYDVVDEYGNYLMHADIAFPSDDDILRPNDTIHRVCGKTIIISYFHNGMICSVRERKD